MSRKFTSKLLECLECKKKVFVPPYRWKDFKFCSRRCSALNARCEEITVCQMCGEDFKHISSRANKAKYCSRECYYKGMKGRGSVILKCYHCEKEFRASPSQNRKYCSRKCIQKSSHKEWKASFTTVRKAMDKRGMIIKCEKCGYDKEPRILGVHHKDEDRKNNELDNLIVLCPTCHSLEHIKHIPQKGI